MIDPNDQIQPHDPIFISDKLMPEDMERLAEHFAKHKGLTIRAHFAAMAMQGMCASLNAWNDSDGKPCMATMEPGQMATYAARYADALIAELNK